ncbi:hypothetical protein [Sphingomonas baiyangensis]|uniref:hypothetical protein n=1 Tax=Sphingomonas baiyangensis TaxID=2572576 RepID=UPI00146AB2F6|nr:hypothetical protein [Sphingomonas baiyangensis]
MAERAFDRWRGRLRERGVAAALAKAFGDHVFRMSESVMMECVTAQARAGGNATTGDVRFAVVRAGKSLPPLGAFLAARGPAFAAMLDAGKVGCFAIRDGLAVGCFWLSLDDHHDAASREHYRVEPGEAYGYCFLLDPAERRRGTALWLVRCGIGWLATQGIARHFTVIDRANRVSYLIQRHFRATERGVRVRHFYILGTRWTHVSRYVGTLGPYPDTRRRRPRLAPT